MCAFPEKVPYDSQMLADNAAALHLIEFPHCRWIESYECNADHWHIGHRQRHLGDECKARHADYDRGVPRDRGTLPTSP
jgi:hypothetical protein